jgi:hypothetical protein
MYFRIRLFGCLRSHRVVTFKLTNDYPAFMFARSQKKGERHMKYPLCAAIALGSMMAIAPSWAADNCSGMDTLFTTATDMTDFGQGVKKMTWTADSIVTSNNSNFDVLVGECSATTLTTPDGSQTEGFCARHDKDGDVTSISTSQAPGADKSEWKTVAGTGKYANKQSSGWAQRIFVEGNVFVVKWGGNCQ